MDEFSKAAARIVDDYLRHEPIEATLAGLHDYDAALPDLTADGLAAADARAKAYLATLQRYAPASLSAGDCIDHGLLVARFATRVKEFAELANHQHDPSLYPNVALMGVYSLLISDAGSIHDRLPSIEARLNGTRAVFAAARANLTRSPAIWNEIALEETGGGLQFLRSEVGALAQRHPSLHGPLERAIDAFAAYARFLTEEHAPRDSVSFALGRELFDFKLRTEHLLPFDAETLLAFGEGAVRDTLIQLERTAASVDPDRSWVELVEGLRSDHPPEATLLEEYRRGVDSARRFVNERSLVTMPRDDTLEVVETPHFLRPTIPYAAYQPPGPFDRRPRGLYYVTPINAQLPANERAEQLLGHNRYAMLLTNVHEAYPGHHLQLQVANETGSLVRKLLENTVLIEGWALYCEQLVLDEGMDNDPRVRLFQLKDQLWRACRVVIDVKLHTGRMSFEEAVEMLVGVAHLERPNAIGEARRYTQSPTQPMSYLTGKHQIMELRERERARLGSRFNLQAFHDRLLSYGSVPIALVEPTFAEVS